VTSGVFLPIVHFCPESKNVVRPGGPRKRMILLSGSLAVDRPLFKADISKAGMHRAGVIRCRWSLVAAVAVTVAASQIAGAGSAL
jgi:hypothetical protein